MRRSRRRGILRGKPTRLRMIPGRPASWVGGGTPLKNWTLASTSLELRVRGSCARRLRLPLCRHYKIVSEHVLVPMCRRRPGGGGVGEGQGTKMKEEKTLRGRRKMDDGIRHPTEHVSGRSHGWASSHNCVVKTPKTAMVLESETVTALPVGQWITVEEQCSGCLMMAPAQVA